jgi:hypothetical protein
MEQSIVKSVFFLLRDRMPPVLFMLLFTLAKKEILKLLEHEAYADLQLKRLV